MGLIKTIIRRVVINALTEGAIRTISATGLPNEEFKDREMQQHYGFASSLLDGAEGLIIGRGNVFYLIGSDDRRYRIELARGEVALYTDEGDKIHMKRGKTIEILGQTKVIVNSPAVEMGNGAQYKLADERIVTAINALTFGGHTIDAPLVIANVATAKTKAS